MNLRAFGPALLICFALSAPALFGQDAPDEKKAPPAPRPDLFAEFESAVSIEHLSPHIDAMVNDPQLAYLAGEFPQLDLVLGTLRYFTETIGSGPERVELGFDNGAQYLLLSAVQVAGAAVVTQDRDLMSVVPNEDRSLLFMFTDVLPPQSRLSLVASKVPKREIASLREDMAQWRMMAPSAITATETELVLDLAKVVQLFSLPLVVSAQLPVFGATPEQAEALKNWLENLRGEARLTTADDWIRADVTVGEKATPDPSLQNRAALVRELSSTTPEVLYRLDLASIKSRLPHLQELAAGTIPDRARGSIDFGTKTRMVQVTSKEPRKPQDLRTSDLARCVPGDVASAIMCGDSSLLGNSFFKGFLEGFRTILSEGESTRQRALEAIDRAVPRLTEAFAIGWGIIADEPKPMKIRGEFADLSTTWEKAPVPPMALLFRTLDPAASLGQISSTFGDLLGELGLSEDSSRSVLREEDVGLGVRSWVLDLAGVASYLDLDLSLSYADAATGTENMIHAFQVGSVQVVSNDLGLSRRILEQSKKPLPEISAGDPITFETRGSLEWLTNGTRALGAWLRTDDAKFENQPEIDQGRVALVERFDRQVAPIADLLSRVQFVSRTQQVDRSNKRQQAELTVAPPPQDSFARLKPSVQKDLVSATGLERLLACQQEDGRFVDPDSEGLSDLALTALSLLVLDKTGFSFRTREHRLNAIAWLSQQQVTEGPYRGFIGDPDDSDAWDHQGMIIASLGPRFSPFTPEQSVIEHLIKFLNSDKLDRDWTIEQACWLDEVSTREDELKRFHQLEPEVEYVLEHAIEKLRNRARAIVAAEPASGPISAIALERSRFGPGDDYVKLAKANLHRFFPETMNESSDNTSLWELRAIGDLARGSRKLSFAWIDAIASQKYRGESKKSWPHLPPPYHTEVSSLAAKLFILDEFNDERIFELSEERRKQFPDMLPDLDD